MKHAVPLLVVFLGLMLTMGSPGRGGEWEPDPHRPYLLEVPDGASGVSERSDERWLESLVLHLRERGANVESARIYPLVPGARLTRAGVETAHRIYEIEQGARWLCYAEGDTPFVVDQAEQKVLVAAGPSFHLHPSRRFVVAVFAPRQALSGVPVQGESAKVQFREGSVSWQ